MNYNEIINKLALRIAQMEVDKSVLEVKVKELEDKLKEECIKGEEKN